ncbi:MAG TPA: cation:dicarboxylase symporter family transporter, partial [Gemmatimonadaceae bacterium]|nr:cation:dicarboxylase symporter family transporter [Gemmatimonadaceae bacterium]
MKMPAAPIRALIGLGLGLVVGGIIVATGSPAGRVLSEKIEPLGTMWVNGLRMTVVPLVMSLLVATLGSNEGARMFGTFGRRAIGIFLALLVVIAVIGLVAAPPIYSMMQVDPAAAAALRASAGVAPTTTPPTFASWVVSLVPSNVIATASDGTMLPLIVFAALFGLALAKLDPEHRAPAVGFFRAIADAMLAIVRWVLLLAPIGAFALAVSLAVHLGNATASVILFYLVSHSG